MADKNNATCSICGSEYYACFSCKEAMNLHPWKLHCCSVGCYKAFQTVRGFSTGVYSKDEFKSKLKNLDLSNLDNYREHIKALIKNALNEKTVVRVVEEVSEKVEEPVEQVTMTEKETIVETPVYSRKRSYKINNKTVEVE